MQQQQQQAQSMVARPATAGRDVRTELQRKEHELGQLRMAALRALEQQVTTLFHHSLFQHCHALTQHPVITPSSHPHRTRAATLAPPTCASDPSCYAAAFGVVLPCAAG
jgi:hypothetical protein